MDRSSWLHELTSREFAGYLNSGGDLALVPVGALERLGPHLPLAAGIYTAQAVSLCLACKNNGICVPVLPFSSLYDTGELTGSLSVEPRILYRLLYNLCEELISNGFGRIILVGESEELYYLVHEFYQKENVAIVWTQPSRIPVKGAADRHEKATWLAAAALKLCGRHDLLQKLLEKNSEYYGKIPSSWKDTAPLSGLKSLGKVGYRPGAGEYDILPVRQVDTDGALLSLDEWADEMKTAVAALKEYNGFLVRRRFDRGVNGYDGSKLP